MFKNIVAATVLALATGGAFAITVVSAHPVAVSAHPVVVARAPVVVRTASVVTPARPATVAPLVRPVIPAPMVIPHSTSKQKCDDAKKKIDPKTCQ
jgi:hypothetical protein